ncbi:MAG: Fic family protein, partial [Elusimicrobia bacterium]|nr:Fic family protein [Elusimicrobiota bacterium]
SWIHPFRNGNGRHARLVADIYLRSHGHGLPVWPSAPLAANGAARDEYLRAVREADLGDFLPLVGYTKRYLPAT